MESKRHESYRIKFNRAIKILFIFLGVFGIFSMASIKSDVLALNQEYGTFITGGFWASNPSDSDIKSKLYDVDSAYIRDWTGSINCMKNGMKVYRGGALPSSLSSNTIYVLTSATIQISDTIDVPNCVAIVSSVSEGTLITTSKNITKKGVFNILDGNANVIIDNINIEGRYYNTLSDHGKNYVGIYIGGGSNPTTNVTVNNSTISNYLTGIYMPLVKDGYIYESYVVLSNIRLINNNYGISSNNTSDILINNVIGYGGTGISLNNSQNTSVNNANFSIIDSPEFDIVIGTGVETANVVLNNIMGDIYTYVSDCHVNKLIGNIQSSSSTKKCKVYGYHNIFNGGSYQGAQYNVVSPSGLGWVRIGNATQKGCVTWDYITSPVAYNDMWLYDWQSNLSENNISSGCFVDVPAPVSYAAVSLYDFSFGSGVPTQIQPVKWSSSSVISNWITDYETGKFIGGDVTKVIATHNLPNEATGSTSVTINSSSIFVLKYRLLGPHIKSGSNSGSWVYLGLPTTVEWEESDGSKTLVAQLMGNNHVMEHFVLETIKENFSKGSEPKSRSDSKVATLLLGSEVNSVLRKLDQKGDCNSFQRSYKLPEGCKEEDWQSCGTLISDKNLSDTAVIAWYDEKDGNIYYYTDADTIYMNEDSSIIFQGLSCKAIDVSDFDTSKVTSMRSMFAGCSRLESLDLMSFDTSKVTDMAGMFEGCNRLESLNLSNFDTSKVTDMAGMFEDCNNLESLNLMSFDTSKVETMADMFKMEGKSVSLKTIYSKSFDTSSLKDKGTDMFFGNYSLVGGNGTKYSTENVDVSYAIVDGEGGKKAPGYFTLWKNATLLSGDAVNSVLKLFDQKGECNSFQRSYKLPEGCKEEDWQSCGTLISDENLSDTAVIAWYDEKDGNIYYYTDADTIYMNEDSRNMFEGLSCKSIVVGDLDTSKVASMETMFAGCSSLESLDLSNFDTSKVTDMSSMFEGCSSLESLDLSNFDTSEVTDMRGMFYGCSSLKSLDLSNFDTSKVTDMSSMFGGCIRLESLNLMSFDTSKVQTMQEMFKMGGKSVSLKTIYSKSFDTSSLKDKGADMFKGAVNLVGGNGTKYSDENVDVRYAIVDGEGGKKAPGYFTLWKNAILLPGNDVSSILKGFDQKGECNSFQRSYKLPEGCKEEDWQSCGTLISDKDLSDTAVIAWYDKNDRNIYYYTDADIVYMNEDSKNMFKGLSCGAIDVADFDTSNVANMGGMFDGCSSLESLDLSNFDTSKVTRMDLMFAGCSSLESLNLSNFDTSKVTGMKGMFDGCSSLKSLNLSNFDTSKVTTMGGMFYGCNSLESLNLSNFDTSKVTSMRGMFDGCSSLESLNLSNFDTSKVTDMAGMFDGCSSLESLNLMSFDTSKVEYMEEMFKMGGKSVSLKTIYSKSFDTSSLMDNGENMFLGNFSLVGGNGTKYRTENVDVSYAIVDGEGGKKAPGYFTLLTHVTLLTGRDFNSIMNGILDNGNYRCNSFQRSYSLPEDCKPEYWQNCGRLISDDAESDTAMIAWYDKEDGNIYYYTDADEIYLGRDSSHMFEGLDCVTLDLSGRNTINVTNMQYMFSNMYNLQYLNLMSFDTRNVEYMENMFAKDISLQTIYSNDFNQRSLSDRGRNMFYDDRVLVGGRGTSYDPSFIDSSRAYVDQPRMRGYFTLDENAPTATVEYKYFVSGTRAILTGYSESIIITNNGGSNTMRFPYTGSNFRGVFEYQDIVGNTGSTEVWGWNNEWYITSGFWTNNPTTGEVINAVYGDGDGNADKTAYTKLWSGITCNPTSMNVVYVDPGYNTVLDSLSGNTIYVLNGGAYTKNAEITMANCSAIIGKTDDVYMYTTAAITSQINVTTKNNIVIDNVKLDGTRVNQYSTGVQHGFNTYGIYANTTIKNMTVNRVESHDNVYGIYLYKIGDNIAVIENSQFYDNELYGIYISLNSSIVNGGIMINNVQVYGNSFYGIYLTTTSSTNSSRTVINNSQIYNNGSYGVYTYKNTNFFMNNVEVYNNYSRGVYMNYTSNSSIKDSKVYNNGSYAISIANASSIKYYGTIQLFDNKYDSTTSLVAGSSSDYPTLGFSNGSISKQGNMDCSQTTISNHWPTSLTGTCNNKSITWGTRLDRQPSSYVYGSNQKKQVQPIAYVNGTLTIFDTTGYNYDSSKYLGEVNPAPLVGSISMSNDMRYTESQTALLTLRTSKIGASFVITGDVTTINGTMSDYSQTQDVALSAGTGYKDVYITYTFNGQTATDHIIIDYINISNDFSGSIINKYFGSGSEYIKTRDQNNVCDPSQMTVQVVNPGTNAIPQALQKNTIYVLNPGKYIFTEYRYFNGNCIVLAGSGNVVIYGSYEGSTSTDSKKILFSAANKRNIIIDNIKVDGLNNGDGGTHNTPIPYGMRIYNYSRYIAINNIQSFNMSSYGLYIYDYARQILVNNSQFFNNSYGIYLSGYARYNNINNVQCFNNKTVGLYAYNYSYPSITNSQFYNNKYGIYMKNYVLGMISDTKIYNNSTAGLYFYGTLNDSYTRYYNNVWIFNNASASSKTGTVNTNEYYGLLKVFGNGSNTLNGGFVNTNTGMNTYGWTAGVLSNTGEMGCDLVANPRNSNGEFLQTGENCDVRGYISGWTDTYITGMKYGSNQIKQVQPISYTIGGGKKYYGTEPFDYDTTKPIAHAYPITDIVLQATATSANQTLTINKYFANAYTVDRGDGSAVQNLTADTTHTYTTAGTYTITLSLSGADRWAFKDGLKALVPKSGTTMTGVQITYMPSLADGFGNSATAPGNNFFSQFNRDGAIISLPAGSFDTSNIVSVGDDFFTSFNNSGYLISLPDGSFNISNISGVVGDKFFAWFNSEGKITSLPDGSFNTSNITAVGDDFFDAFNQRGAITGLPNGSFDISNISGVVGDNFFGYFNFRGSLTSLPNGSFNISNISGVVGDNFFDEFNFGGSLTSLPDGSFDISNITMVGNDFFNRFNEIGQLISLPTGSFNTSNISGVVGDNFFNSFNYEGKLTSLPDGSFDILNITSVGSKFFYAFNTMGIITSLPEGSFDTSNITTVGDEYFAYFNMYGGLTSLPDGSFRLSTGLNIVSNDFFFEFNTLGGLVDLPGGSFDTSHIRAVGDNFFQFFNYDGKITSLPEGSFDMSNITSAGDYFFSHFNYDGALTSLPSSFTISSVGAAGSGGYIEAFNSSNYTLNKNVSDLVSGVVAPSSDRNTFSDNQPGRCGVDPNWLVTTADACSITYDSNGGSTIANPTKKYTADTTSVVAGSGITTPTRANYAFDGWYNASVGGTKFTTVTFPAMDSGTLYAHWREAVPPTVTISSEGIGMCVAPGTVYTVTGSFTEAVTGIDASTLTVINGTVQDFQVVSGNVAVWTVGKDTTISDYIYESSIKGINTLTICDPNGSTSCVTMMDRNLGATTNDINSTDSYGYYYQRGKNGGYGTYSSVTTGGSQINCSANSPSNPVSSSVFIVGYNDYCTTDTRNDNLRGGGSDGQSNRGYDTGINRVLNPTDRQGPCPSDYHVPSAGERSKVVEYYAENYSEDIIVGNGNDGLKSFNTRDNGDSMVVTQALVQMKEDLKIPFAGRRNFGNAGLESQGFFARFWSSSSKNDESISVLYSNGQIRSDVTMFRADGFSVRCFKDIPIIPDTNNWTVSVTIETGAFVDLAGNANTTGSNTISWNYDDEGPTSPTLSSPANSGFVNTLKPTLSWNDDTQGAGCNTGKGGYEILVCTDSGCDTAVQSKIYDTNTTTWTLTTNLTNGTKYYWKVRAKDGLGNWGEWSSIWNFTVDTTAPVCSWGEPSKTDLKSGATGSIVLTCTDSIGVSTNILNSGDITLSSQYMTLSNATVGGTATGRTFTFVYTAKSSVNGTVRFTLPANKVYDIAGNAAATTGSAQVIVDNIKPYCIIFTQPTKTPLRAGETGSVAFTCTSTGSEITTTSLAANAVTLSTGFVTLNSAVVTNVTNGKKYTFVYTAKANVDGPVTFKLKTSKVNDAAGNTNAATSVSNTVIVDNSEPVCTWGTPSKTALKSGVSGSIDLICTDSIGISTNALNGSDITLSNQYVTLSNATVKYGEGGTTFTFIYTAKPNVNGTVTFTLPVDKVYDTVGNVARTVSSIEVMVDNIKPYCYVSSGPTEVLLNAGETGSISFTCISTGSTINTRASMEGEFSVNAIDYMSDVVSLTLDDAVARDGNVYYKTVDGVNTITVCDPNNSNDCITMQDMNLGATTNDITSTGSYGHHFQWGNNHGFASCFINGCTNFPGGETYSTSRVDTSAYGPGHPYDSNVFIQVTSDPWDWSILENGNLWGGTGDNESNKFGYPVYNPIDRQGPCSSGYHVPSIGEWNKLMEYWISYENMQGYGLNMNTNTSGLNYFDTGLNTNIVVHAATERFRNNFYLPYDGVRDYYDNSVLGLGWAINLATSTPSKSSSMRGVYTFAMYSNLMSSRAINDTAGAVPVRCFKNSALTIPSVSEGLEYTFTYTANADGITTFKIKTGQVSDEAGNLNDASEVSDIVTVDATAPVCTWGTPSKEYIKAGESGTITLICSDSVGVATTSLTSNDITMTEAGLVTLSNATTGGTATNRTFTFTYSTIANENGRVKFTLPANKVYDISNNYTDSTGSATIVVVDTLSPTMAFVSPTPADNVWQNQNYFTGQVEITEANLSGFTWTMNGNQTNLYDDSLVLMYNFDDEFVGPNPDEFVGGNLNERSVRDASMYRRHGIVHGASLTDDGKWGGAYSFSGTVNSYISFPDYGPLNQYGTISFWMKGPLTSSYVVLIGNRSGLAVGMRSSSILGRIGTSSNKKPIGNMAYYNNNGWNHVVVSNDNGTLSYYINGKKLTNSSTTDYWSWPYSGGSIGKRIYNANGTPNISYDRPFTGQIDEVRVYNRALSAAEIQELYRGNLAKTSTDTWTYTVAYTGLADGTYTYGGTAVDRVGQSASVSRTINIDTVPPTKPTFTLTYVSGGGTHTNGNWANKQFRSIINTVEANTLTNIQYKIGNGSWSNIGGSLAHLGTTWTGSESWTLRDGRNDTVTFRAKDLAGNISEESDIMYVKYDTTKPVVALSGNFNVSYANSGTTITGYIKVTDTGAGITTGDFVIGDLSFKVGSTTVTPSTKTLVWQSTANGVSVYLLTLSGVTGNGALTVISAASAVADAAGNNSASTTLTPGVTIDNTKPTCSITGNPTNWTNQDVTLTLSMTDTNVNTNGYKRDNGNYGSTTTLSVVENGMHTGYVKDLAGNVGSCSTGVTKIDKVKPLCTVYVQPTNTPISLNAGYNTGKVSFICRSTGSYIPADLVSDPLLYDNRVVNVLFVQSSLNAYMPEVEYIFTYTARGAGSTTFTLKTGVVTDEAGNSNDKAGPSNTVVVDTTRPNPPKCTENACYSGSIGVMCISNESTIKYTTNGNNPTCSSSTWNDQSFTTTTTLKVAVCDAAGNLSDVKTYEYTVDSDSPNVPEMVAEPEFTSGLTNTVSANEVRDNGCNGHVEYQFCMKTEAEMRDGSEIRSAIEQLGGSGAEGIERTEQMPGKSQKYVDLGNKELEIIAWYNENEKKIYIYTEKTAIKLPNNSEGMFSDMKNLVSVDLGDIDTSEVTNMAGMFAGCSNLTELDLSQFDTRNVGNMSSMFEGDGKLVTIYATDSFITKKVEKGEKMFEGCDSLVGGMGSSYDKYKITNQTAAHIDEGEKNPGYFTEKEGNEGGKSAIFMPGSEFNEIIGVMPKSPVVFERTGGLPKECDPRWECGTMVSDKNSERPIVLLFDQQTNSVYYYTDADKIYLNPDSREMFKGLWFTSIDLTDIDTSEVINMSGMFAGCSNLIELDLSQFDTRNVQNMEGMFEGDGKLVTIYATDSFITNKVEKGEKMFEGCDSLAGGMGSSYAKYKITNQTAAHIDGGEKNPGYFTEGQFKKGGAKAPVEEDISCLDVIGWQDVTVATFNNLTDGTTYYYFVRSRDGLGNISRWSRPTRSTQDNTAPVCSWGSPSTNACISGGVAGTITLTCNDEVGIYTNSLSSTSITYSGTLFTLTDATVGGTATSRTFQFIYTSKAGVNGTGKFILPANTVKDNVDHFAATTGSNTVTVDTTAPTTTATMSTTSWSCSANDVTVTLTPSTSHGCDSTNTTYYCKGANNCTPSTQGTSVTISASAGGLATGYVRYYSKDGLGNTESVQSTGLIYVDKKGPNKPTGLGATETNNLKPTLKWTAPSDNGCSSVAGYQVQICSNSTCTTVNQSGTVTSPTWTATSNLTSGTVYKWRVRAKDALGNWGDWETGTVAVNSLTFNATQNGGTTTALTQYRLSGSNITLSTSTYPATKTGYTFVGWNTSSTATTSQSSITLNGNKTVYAIFTPNITTPYVVKHYKHNLASTTYTLAFTDNLSGTSDSSLTLSNLVKFITGYTYEAGYANTGTTTRPSAGAVTTTTILPDGSRLINLYYRPNYLFVQYDMNGGYLAASHGANYGVSGSLITYTNNTLSGSTKFLYGLYGSKVGGVTLSTYTVDNNGLANYNNSNAINILRTGYNVPSGSEWNTQANGQGTLYNHASSTYDANGFAGTSLNNGDAVATLYVNWKPIVYTITYNLNGGTNNASNPSSYAIESGSITLQVPTKTGYTFKGWTGSNGSTAQTSVTISAGSYGDKTYNAVWQANTYKISYVMDGGVNCSPAPTTAIYDVIFTGCNNPTKTGYTFAGWKITGMGVAGVTHTYGDDTTTATSIASTTATTFKNLHSTSGSTVTFTALWTVNSYTLTINPNGGVYNGTTNNTTVTQNYGTNYTMLYPTKTGYTFAGWQGNSAVDWSGSAFNVYNNKGGGTVSHSWVNDDTSPMNSQVKKIVTSGVAAPGAGGFYQAVTAQSGHVYYQVYRAKVPVGYTLNWAGNSIGSGSSHPALTSQAGIGDWAIYVFRTNAGLSGSFSSFGHIYVSGPDNTNVTWYVASAQIYDATAGIIKADLQQKYKFTTATDQTVTAQWTPNTYYISYNKNGGVGTMSNTNCIYDSDCTLRSNTFIRTGYTFKGWSTSSNATSATYINGESVSNLTGINGNTVTLYAVWKDETAPICSWGAPSTNACIAGGVAGTITLTCTDGVGVSTNALTSGAITYSGTLFTLSNATVGGSATSKIFQFTYTSKNNVNGGGKFILPENTVKDAAGNSAVTTGSTVITVDTTAPSTTASGIPSSWTGSNVTVGLSTSTSNMGCNSTHTTYYCVDTANTCTPSTTGTSVSVECAAGSKCTKYVRFYSKDELGNAESTQSKTVNIDKEGPTFTFSNNSGAECTAGSLSITSASDNNGVGLASSAYKFGGGSWGTATSTGIAARQPGNVTVTGYVRDSLGNETAKTATYTINDVAPSANNFSVDGVGYTIDFNWIERSNATDGDCGVDGLVGSVLVNGTQGNCEIYGKFINYVAIEGASGSDTCTVLITDDDGSTGQFIVTWNDIYRPVPHARFVSPTPEDGVVRDRNRFTTKAEISNVDNFTLTYNFNDSGYIINNPTQIYNFDNMTQFGEVENEIVKDSLHSDTGIVHGATWVSSGKYGGAYYFDGVDDYIELGQELGYGRRRFTVTYRIKPEGGDWSFVILPSYGGSIYINGIPVSELPSELSLLDDATIGRNQSESQYFNGLIDEIIVYNSTEMTDDLAQFLYRSNLKKTGTGTWEFETINPCLDTSGSYEYSLLVEEYSVETSASTGRTLTTDIPGVSVEGTGYDFGIYETTGSSYVLSGTMGRLIVTDYLGKSGWKVYFTTSPTLVGQTTQETIDTNNLKFKATNLVYSGLYNGVSNTHVTFGSGISTDQYRTAHGDTETDNILEYIVRTEDTDDFMCGDVGTYSDNTQIQLDVPAWQVEDTYKGILWITLQDDTISAKNSSGGGDNVKK